MATVFMVGKNDETPSNGGHRHFHVLDTVVRYQVLLLGLGIMAYGFAYIAEKYLMNLLGVPVGLPISPLEYANTVLAIAFASLVSSLLILAPLLALAYFPFQFAGFSLAGWRASIPMKPLWSLLLIGVVAGALLPHLMLIPDLASSDGLLTLKHGQDKLYESSPFLLAMTQPLKVPLVPYALFGVLIIAIIILSLALQKHLMFGANVRIIMASAFAALLAFSVCLFPVSFAALWLPKTFPNVFLEQVSPASLETIERFEGQLILATANDVVPTVLIFAEN